VQKIPLPLAESFNYDIERLTVCVAVPVTIRYFLYPNQSVLSPFSVLHKPTPPPQAPAQLAPLHRSMSLDQMKPGDRVMSPAGSQCGHSNAGQELCYLCHQRARRNIPVSFTEERRRREEEEDRLLQQYQYMKDAENVLSEQVGHQFNVLQPL